jgi:hypothetical protein
MAFKAAIDRVSANGQVRWGVEHLFYELCRNLARRSSFVSSVFGKFLTVALIGLFGAGSIYLLSIDQPILILVLLAICVGIAWLVRKRARPATIRLTQSEFDKLWKSWLSVHAAPPGLIVRKSNPAPRRSKERDIADYSFDRAVICDRARTVDLLIANNFHFENNCAVLSIGGYPEGPFDLVRTMLKRNPKLHVFALHDATAVGCRLAYKLANDDAWFKGQATVTDVGLRPRHAPRFAGLYQSAGGGEHLQPGEGILAGEIGWLNTYALELAAIRPEQILKRLFKAINQREQAGSDSGGGDGGGTGGESGTGSGGESSGAAVAAGGMSGGGGGGGYFSDDSSLSADAADSDGGGDSFG